jgi:hypothetical protein
MDRSVARGSKKDAQAGRRTALLSYLGNVSAAPWVFILGALATTLLIAIPLAMALMMGSGGKEETYGGYGGDAGYDSSPSSGYAGGEYRYFFNSRKKRSSGIDVKINSKC